MSAWLPVVFSRRFGASAVGSRRLSLRGLDPAPVLCPGNESSVVLLWRSWREQAGAAGDAAIGGRRACGPGPS